MAPPTSPAQEALYRAVGLCQRCRLPLRPLQDRPHPRTYSTDGPHTCTYLTDGPHVRTRLMVLTHVRTQLTVLTHVRTKLTVLIHVRTQLAVLTHVCTKLTVLTHVRTQLTVLTHVHSHLTLLIHVRTQLTVLTYVRTPPTVFTHVRTQLTVLTHVRTQLTVRGLRFYFGSVAVGHRVYPHHFIVIGLPSSTLIPNKTSLVHDQGAGEWLKMRDTRLIGNIYTMSSLIGNVVAFLNLICIAKLLSVWCSQGY